MDPVLTSTTAVLVSKAFGLAAPRLRLRASIQHADPRRLLLVDLAGRLPAGGALVDQRSDGTRIAALAPSALIH